MKTRRLFTASLFSQIVVAASELGSWRRENREAVNSLD